MFFGRFCNERAWGVGGSVALAQNSDILLVTPLAGQAHYARHTPVPASLCVRGGCRLPSRSCAPSRRSGLVNPRGIVANAGPALTLVCWYASALPVIFLQRITLHSDTTTSRCISTYHLLKMYLEASTLHVASGRGRAIAVRPTTGCVGLAASDAAATSLLTLPPTPRRWPSARAVNEGSSGSGRPAAGAPASARATAALAVEDVPSRGEVVEIMAGEESLEGMVVEAGAGGAAGADAEVMRGATPTRRQHGAQTTSSGNWRRNARKRKASRAGWQLLLRPVGARRRRWQ